MRDLKFASFEFTKSYLRLIDTIYTGGEETRTPDAIRALDGIRTDLIKTAEVLTYRLSHSLSYRERIRDPDLALWRPGNKRPGWD